MTTIAVVKTERSSGDPRKDLLDFVEALTGKPHEIGDGVEVIYAPALAANGATGGFAVLPEGVSDDWYVMRAAVQKVLTRAVEAGVVQPRLDGTLVKSKVPLMNVRREVLLRAHRGSGKAGIVTDFIRGEGALRLLDGQEIRNVRGVLSTVDPSRLAVHTHVLGDFGGAAAEASSRFDALRVVAERPTYVIETIRAACGGAPDLAPMLAPRGRKAWEPAKWQSGTDHSMPCEMKINHKDVERRRKARKAAKKRKARNAA